MGWCWFTVWNMNFDGVGDLVCVEEQRRWCLTPAFHSLHAGLGDCEQATIHEHSLPFCQRIWEASEYGWKRSSDLKASRFSSRA